MSIQETPYTDEDRAFFRQVRDRVLANPDEYQGVRADFCSQFFERTRVEEVLNIALAPDEPVRPIYALGAATAWFLWKGIRNDRNSLDAINPHAAQLILFSTWLMTDPDADRYPAGTDLGTWSIRQMVAWERLDRENLHRWMSLAHDAWSVLPIPVPQAETAMSDSASTDEPREKDRGHTQTSPENASQVNQPPLAKSSPTQLPAQENEVELFHSGDESDGEWTAPHPASVIAAKTGIDYRAITQVFGRTGLIQISAKKWKVRCDNVGNVHQARALNELRNPPKRRSQHAPTIPDTILQDSTGPNILDRNTTKPAI